MYRLYVEDDSLFEEWDLVMNFSDLWNKYENKELSLEGFVKNYKFRVNEYKDTIVNKKGIEIWNDLVNILNDFKSYEITTTHKKLDEVYDWADKNNVEIKTKN